MKKSVVLSILGIAASLTAFGQGGIIFDNSQPTVPGGTVYNPVVWAPGSGGTGGVRSTDGVVLTFWYGAGVLTADQLAAGPVAAFSTGLEGAGYYGYYAPTAVTLPTWTAGQTFTFQLRASGNSIYGAVDTVASRSILWQENANIAFIGGTPAGLPGSSTERIGLSVSVPEPATMAVLGLGLAALVTLRRRS